MRTLVSAVAIFLVLCFAPGAIAGTQEAPEMTDAEGDCAFPPGNEYMDLTAAWISDETATDFNVNVAIAKFNDAMAAGTGITIQFTHQGVQFGVVGAHQGPDGWFYGNALVDESGVSEIVETSGSFTPGTPSILSVKFLKSNFPHGDATDNRLVDFFGGSVDLKPLLPFLATGQEPPGSFSQGQVDCDDITGDVEYTFAVGDHSSHEMGGSADASDDTEADDATGDATSGAASPTEDLVPQAAPDKGVPAPGLGLALVAVALALAWRRRSP